MTCTKCEKPTKHAICVRDDDGEGTLPGEKDQRAIRIVGLCEEHWDELTDLLKAA